MIGVTVTAASFDLLMVHQQAYEIVRSKQTR